MLVHILTSRHIVWRLTHTLDSRQLSWFPQKWSHVVIRGGGSRFVWREGHCVPVLVTLRVSGARRTDKRTQWPWDGGPVWSVAWCSERLCDLDCHFIMNATLDGGRGCGSLSKLYTASLAQSQTRWRQGCNGLRAGRWPHLMGVGVKKAVLVRLAGVAGT